jgi:hypothetical protein
MADFHPASAFAAAQTSHAHKQSTLAKDLMSHEDHMTAAKAHKKASQAHKHAAAALAEHAGLKNPDHRPDGKGFSHHTRDAHFKPSGT